MKSTTDPAQQLHHLVAALDDEPPSDEEAREVVAALGVDVSALAARIRASAAASLLDTSPAAKLRAAFEASRAKPRAPEPIRPRKEQIARIEALMARANQRGQGAGVVAHFRKLEEAGDEELASLCTSLRDLVGDDDPS